MKKSKSNLNLSPRTPISQADSAKQNISETDSTIVTSSLLRTSFKGADRATLILLLISACFVLLNLPYVTAWANFIRYELESTGSSSVESKNASYQSYSFIPLAKILHIANFSINFFLYCLASKRFRTHLMVGFINYFNSLCSLLKTKKFYKIDFYLKICFRCERQYGS